jgi:type IV secretion system protein TrbL
VRGGAATAGAATAAYSVGSPGQSGAAGIASGLGGVARAAGSAAVSPLKRAASRASESVKSSFTDGARAGFAAGGGTSSMGTVGGESAAPVAAPRSPTGSPPAWAQRMQRSQAMSHGTTMAAHAVRSGDSHGSGSSVNLSESDRS